MPPLILSAEEFLEAGLTVIGFDVGNSHKTNLRRFKSFYGSIPLVYAEMWEDLQASQNPNAHVEAKSIKDVRRFLLAIFFLKVYATESITAAFFKFSEKTARKWAWHYAKKIRALKEEKIVWDTLWNEHWGIFFGMSIDGVHFRTNEEEHPVLAQNPQALSYKYNNAGLSYGIGLSIFEDAVIWLSGPHLASKHDMTIARESGLLEKIPEGGRVVADNGYRGEAEIFSTPNAHDSPELRKFKSRASARHETFNRRLKTFGCLKDHFRHKLRKHKYCFEAVVVICQYQMELGSPLFDV